MRRLTVFATTLVAAVFVLISTGRAAAADDAKTIITKAIQAHGGLEKLKQFANSRTRVKGTLDFMGMEVEWEGEIIQALPSRRKLEMTMTAMGQEFKVVQVLDGDKGWAESFGTVVDLTADQLKQLKEQAHADNVENLYPLLDGKGFKLAVIGDAQVRGKPAVGVQVSSEGYPDIKLFFDKATGMLLKIERKGIDFNQQPVNMATYYSDYKEKDGVKYAAKVEVEMDGTPFMKGTVTEVEFLDKVDAKVFARP